MKSKNIKSSDSLRRIIRDHTRSDEDKIVRQLLAEYPLNADMRKQVSEATASLVEELRKSRQSELMEKFLGEYGLNTDEGVALMCLAEAYLRTPDAQSLSALIADKIGGGDWARHIGKARSALVNTSTWALMLTGKVFRAIPAETDDLAGTMRQVVRRLGEPVARRAVGEAMKILGQQFVLGRNIGEALKNAETGIRNHGERHSFDMLGEAARTSRDAERYFLSYSEAISEIAKVAKSAFVHDNPGISVKLSALHPRYETTQKTRVMEELVPRVLALAQTAKAANIGFAIDAEEADRLDLSLDVIEAVLSSRSLVGWDGFGIVVQAYSKRAPYVLDWLHQLATNLDRKISIRLVKGAYWDAEIKNCQVLGLSGYPVFTRKQATDVSYLYCARKLLDFASADGAHIYPQFATHNAHTVSAINAMAGTRTSFEFQRLHGMGEPLHHAAAKSDHHPRRVYAPVGVHEDLLAYLVRRLLENGANSSFVHQLLDPSVSPQNIARDPADELGAMTRIPHPAIPLPADIFRQTNPDQFGFSRANSKGWNINDPAELAILLAERDKFATHQWVYAPSGDQQMPVINPANSGDLVGSCKLAGDDDVASAIANARHAFQNWSTIPATKRAAILEKTATLIEENTGELIALTTREAGKSLSDGVAEIREAADFLRYYAAQLQLDERFARTSKTGLGIIACISPWNFPLAIFVGQISAALAAGNCVIAKPAEQTPLIAERVCELFAMAGLPQHVLQLLQGDGARIGPLLTASSDLAGLAFTGSTATARLIDISLAMSGNPAAGLVAETGGINAMIVDSTALPEQAVRDIVNSAFQSAGQRCSALRLLCVQKDIAPKLLTMLEGAARELTIGDPWQVSTDIGPLIDSEAHQSISDYCSRMEKKGALIFKTDLPRAYASHPPSVNPGQTFLQPHCFRLAKIGDLKEEIFGPVLHVVEFEGDQLDLLVDEINALGYGLTLGIHSRIDTRVDRICARAKIGNIYVNRNQIGAVVGVQPFGGEGMSGTGPKAGGPLYLTRFANLAGHTAEPSGGKTAKQIASKGTALHGPTGERNTYHLAERGLVLCVGSCPDELAGLAAMAKIAGNDVKELLINESGEYDLDLLTMDHLPDLLLIGDVPDKGLRKLRMELAALTGPRIAVFASTASASLLQAESVVSEDTTASGGNASLLSSVT